MKGLLTKDFLTIKKKYGLPRVIMDIAIIIALMFILEKSGTIYISFLLINDTAIPNPQPLWGADFMFSVAHLLTASFVLV